MGNTSFKAELTAGQAPQKEVCPPGNTGKQTSIGPLNTRSDKHPTRLSAWQQGEGEFWGWTGGKFPWLECRSCFL
eukprot:8087392-Heterocapsa_arctica.AAC.1